jgi:DMSO/TMAO reductase YedYZ molybdopterin-dependent catalytic subunit
MRADADITSADVRRVERIPPGQHLTVKWPVLHAGTVPRVDLGKWDLQLIGLVDEPVRFTWDEFRALPSIRVLADMHCVTTWSMLDNVWEGVSVREILRHVQVRPEAKFVLAHAEEGWTTNMPFEDFAGEDCVFAWSRNGVPLDPDHGAPLRLIVPRLYAWKSAKWVRAIEFRAQDQPGFWERNGYHNHGDPWTEERFW